MTEIDLRLGDYRTALADVESCNLLLTDTPYSDRTHRGHDDGIASNNESRCYDSAEREQLGYLPWSDADVQAFVKSWAPRTIGWFVTVTDHVLVPSWEDALRAHNRYVFAPLPFVEWGSRPRTTGDGPASWTCFIVVARPRSIPYSRWGSLPGGYGPPPGHGEPKKVVMGGKPLWLGKALVRDYSKPGDLVVDPCCGGATFPLAAAIEGRRAIGAEMNPETFAKAQRRIAKGWTPSLFAEGA